MRVKCACGDPGCVGYVNVDGDSLWVQNGDGKEVMVYLDANAKVSLIKDLRTSLMPDEVSYGG